MSRLSLLLCVAMTLATNPVSADDSLPKQAASALKRAVEFYHGKVAVHGGYVYRYSDDLTKREGEGRNGEGVGAAVRDSVGGDGVSRIA